MSLFDSGRTPGYVPPGGALEFGGVNFSYAEGNQTATVVLAAVSRSAAATTANISNAGCKGALFVVNVTQLPASASTTLALKLFVTAGGVTADFATRTPISATGASLFMVYPGISASAGGVSSPIPRNFGVRMSQSSGATSLETVYSVTMMRID